MTDCKICGNNIGNRTFLAQEMTLGGGEQFEYFECSVCKSLQIKNEPPDLKRYYKDSYFQVPQCKTLRFRKWLKGKCIANNIGQPNLIGWLLAKKFTMPPLFSLIATINTPKSNVLDIGCGSGDLLLDLHSIGYKNLMGLDPYIEKNISYYKNGPQILKCFLEDFVEDHQEKFYLVILNHSLEHMSNHKEVFHSLYRLLQPQGYALIRTPLADSYAWRTYGINWVQLDAPRHLCIHTERSLQILATERFEVEKIIYDSTSFQFAESEQYLKNTSFPDNRLTFTKEELQGFERHARSLNAKGEADQASFILRKM